jgi:hypothetical protein
VTLRVAAALSLLVGAAALLAYLHIMGRGPFAGAAERHLRAMKDRLAPPESVETFTLADFVALPHRAAVGGYAPLERRGVVMEGYVQRMIRAVDDDYHLEIAPTPRAPAGADTVYVSAEITPGIRRGSRRWSYERLVASFHPNDGGVTSWDEGPRRARVSGWLLYDYPYDAPPSAWAIRMSSPRISGWEIHPVTRIELWDDSLRRFVDVPR